MHLPITPAIHAHFRHACNTFQVWLDSIFRDILQLIDVIVRIACCQNQPGDGILCRDICRRDHRLVHVVRVLRHFAQLVRHFLQRSGNVSADVKLKRDLRPSR